MAQTSVPRRYTGAVRTVSSSDGWKPTLYEYTLTQDQLARYKAGEKLEDILKGEKDMVLTRERYLDLKSQGVSDTKIAKDFNLKHIGELTQWKKDNFSSEEIEQLRMNTVLARRNGIVNKAALSTSNDAESKTTKSDLSNENKEISKELELLKRELIDAHKLVTEKEELLKDSVQENLRKDELISKLQNQLNKSVELYETAMLDKEQLQKENTNLANRVQTYEREIDNLQKRCDRYQSEYIELEDEVNGLRRFALTKLKKDVYPA
ncbi:hypothetical protein [Heyndrickxia oleronia]|uniref:hypothetical protein n=1 Tax=Heyndrickxia oleronia TaxID=38875 RepID=UPI001C0F0A80|nr:hypothetical protein [Heyndrickxia oleronia]MBU5213240.1 hypothetical protein [Heyndrickxia oleronia]